MGSKQSTHGLPKLLRTSSHTSQRDHWTSILTCGHDTRGTTIHMLVFSIYAELTSPLLTVEQGIRDYQRFACSFRCFRCLLQGKRTLFGKTGSLRNEDVKPSKYQRIFHDENRMGCLKHRVIQPYSCWFKNPAFLTAKSSVNHGIFVLSTGFLPHMTSTFLGKTDRGTRYRFDF